MSAARLTTPNPTTARHGDQPGRGAGTTSGAGSGSAGAGSVPPGCSDTVLLMSAALPVHHRRGATAACRRRSPQCGEQDGGRGAVGRMAALDVEALLVAVVDAAGAQPQLTVVPLHEGVHERQAEAGAGPRACSVGPAEALG